MALDNIFALFLLPLFGALSDKCKSKKGKRAPFIIIGTLLAAVFFFSMSFADNMQLTRINAVSDIDSKQSLETLYEYDYKQTLITPNGKEFSVKDFEKEDFLSITTQTIWVQNDDGSITSYHNNENNIKDGFSPYVDYVSPARRAYAWDTVTSSPSVLVFFVGMLLAALLSMAIFRSPAVALMPDVTVKPLRSKANAVINLMGAAGGIVVLILGAVMATGNAKNSLMPYMGFLGIISAIMIVCLVIFLITVNEPKLNKLMISDSKKYGIETEEDELSGNNKKSSLSKGERKSLILILTSVVLWFFAYNAITSKYSVYAGTVLQKDYNLTLLIAQAAAIVSYLPIGMISSKLGRKKTIIAGIVMLTASFGVASFITSTTPTWLMNCMFVLAGLGWASINVNSFPMVVELSNSSNIGKYTGIYYTASMAAQTATPLLSGFLMDNLGMKVMFPYATVFAGLAIVTMLFVKHGDSVENNS